MRARWFAVLLGVGMVTLGGSVYLRAVTAAPAVALRALAGKQDFISFRLS